MDLFSQLCNGQQFTTVDLDKDKNNEENCASLRQRGFALFGLNQKSLFALFLALGGTAIARIRLLLYYVLL